jgi:hypothetical protein
MDTPLVNCTPLCCSRLQRSIALPPQNVKPRGPWVGTTQYVTSVTSMLRFGLHQARVWRLVRPGTDDLACSRRPGQPRQRPSARWPRPHSARAHPASPDPASATSHPSHIQPGPRPAGHIPPRATLGPGHIPPRPQSVPAASRRRAHPPAAATPPGLIPCGSFGACTCLPATGSRGGQTRAGLLAT